MQSNDFDQDGFIKDSRDWTLDMAQEIADREAIGKLGDSHWKVIQYLRQHYHSSHTLPVMKLVCHELGFDDGCVSQLFGNPEKAWKVAGLPDYGEEFKAYAETAEQPGN